MIHTLVKDRKEDIIQEALLQWGVCSRGERWSSTPDTTKKSRNLSPRSRVWGSVDGKLISGNIKAKETVAKPM